MSEDALREALYCRTGCKAIHRRFVAQANSSFAACTSRQHSVHLFSSVYRRSQATAVRLCLYQRVCWQFQQRSLFSYRLSQPTAKATAVLLSVISDVILPTRSCRVHSGGAPTHKTLCSAKSFIFWPTCTFSRLLYSAWYVTSRQCVSLDKRKVTYWCSYESSAEL